MKNFNEFKTHMFKHYPENIVEKLINTFDNSPTGCLLINQNKTTIEQLKNYFKTLMPHPFIKNAYYFNKEIDKPGKSFLFDNGAYYIMDSSSLIISYLLEINDNDNILDLCAAPGGKSISISLKNKNSNIISNDISMPRILSMRENIERLGIANIVLTNNDFSHVYKKFLNSFDIIILDAPCSGSSMFRKNISAQLDWSIDKVNKCVEIQKALIDIAFQMLKPNGILSYSTCSFSYEENEGVILDFIKKNRNAYLVDIPKIEGEYRHPDLPNAIHLFPFLYKGEGQFVCQIKKVSNEFSNRKINKKLEENKLAIYNLNYFKYQEIFKNHIFLFNNELDLTSLNIIKKGLDAFEIRNNENIPTFHLAHYLPKNNSIKLDESEAKKYLHGDVIIRNNLRLNDGYYIVSFDSINLGIIKKVGSNLKNFYPKGLRH